MRKVIIFNRAETTILIDILRFNKRGYYYEYRGSFSYITTGIK